MAYDSKTQSRPVVSKTHHELLKRKAKKYGRTQQVALETAIEQYQEADYKRKGK